jgi:hypothetical protein
MIRFLQAWLIVLPVLLLRGADTSAPNRYIGGDACKVCHADVWFRFYKNPHFRSIASGKESPANTGCEGCHGPGEAHVKAKGGKATIVAFSQLSPQISRPHRNSCLRKNNQKRATAVMPMFAVISLCPLSIGSMKASCHAPIAITRTVRSLLRGEQLLDLHS